MIEPPNEQFCTSDGVTLCYETFGEPADPAVLLVMGLGTQMLGWHADFCREIARRGFHVIRYDNRDVGRSQRFDEVPPPRPVELFTRRFKHVAYRLDDMADDGIRLLDCLGIAKAHVVGASMGGMIAQVIAGRHPDRVLSLVSIMSTTGNRWKGQPALKAYPFLLGKPPRTKEEAVARVLKIFRLVGSPAFDRDEDELRALAELSFDRGGTPAGFGRQMAAIVATGDRTRDLARIQAPTLVIHGSADILVRPSGGRATARAIRGAKLDMIDGMGHDLPRQVWPRIVQGIVDTAARATSGQAAPLSAA